MALLNLAAWLECTEVEGPGRRFALWVQGCALRCRGCCNQKMLDFVPRHIVEVGEVAQWVSIAHGRHNIEGVTFLGGEPMLQARGLSELAVECRKLDLGVMVFTGLNLAWLRTSGMVGVAELLDATDLLVDGPYIDSRADSTRNWVGSVNQNFHYLTDRYTINVETDNRYSRGVEIRVSSDLRLKVNGYPVGWNLP
jgi:anaerobic ribonucleoside-triphosphate reductase activating protein